MADDSDKARKRQLRKNALRRLLAGLPRHSGAILPSVPDDRYQSLASLYRFASGYARGKRVLDVSCGTGFGCRDLMAAGARSVVGLERQDWAVRHASKRYREKGLEFHQATPAALPDDLLARHGRFDVALGFNVLPRFGDVELLLEELCVHLEDEGLLITSVPVIRDEEALLLERKRATGAGGGFPSLFYPWYWAGILDGCFLEVECFRHLPPEGHAPDFDSPFPSAMDSAEFRFEPVAPEDLRVGSSLAAVFVARAVRR